MSVHSGVLDDFKGKPEKRYNDFALFGLCCNCTLQLCHCPPHPPQPSHTACANQPQSHPPTMMSVTADGAGALAVPASCKRKAEANRPGSPAHDAKIAAKGSRKLGCPRVQPTPRCGKCAPCIAGPQPTGSYRKKCKAPPAGPPLGDHGGGAVATTGWCELSLADLPCAMRLGPHCHINMPLPHYCPCALGLVATSTCPCHTNAHAPWAALPCQHAPATLLPMRLGPHCHINVPLPH